MGVAMYIFAVMFLLIGILRLLEKPTLLKGDYKRKLEQMNATDRHTFLKWNGILSCIIAATFLVCGILGGYWEQKWYWILMLVPIGGCIIGMGYMNNKYM